MTIAFKELLRIIDLYEEKNDESFKEILSRFGTIDTAPQGLPLLEDVLQQELEEGSTVLCSARVGDLWSDPTYNRVDELRYGNQKRHIESTGGFSHSASDVLSTYLRPTSKVVVTKGNNRTSLRYAVGRNPNARITIALKVHRKAATLEEMIQIESRDHNTDCNYRTAQSGDDKFKSAYYAREDWAVKLYTYTKELGIGIAGTNPEAKFSIPSHSFLSTALRLSGEANVTKYLEAFTKHNCAQEILGGPIVAGSLFLKQFSKYIAIVDEENNCDSFGDCLNYFFNQYGALAQEIDPDATNVNQTMITAGSGTYKGNEPCIARFVNLYNFYCRVHRNQIRISGRQVTAIPFEGPKSSAWNKFLESANPLMKPALNGLATTKFF